MTGNYTKTVVEDKDLNVTYTVIQFTMWEPTETPKRVHKVVVKK